MCVCEGEREGIQSEPGKRILPVSISAITQPTDQISTVCECESEKVGKLRERESVCVSVKERVRECLRERESERESAYELSKGVYS